MKTEEIKTEQDLHDLLFGRQDTFSIGSAIQLAFKLLEKDTMFVADAVKIHLIQYIIEYGKHQSASKEARIKELEEVIKFAHGKAHILHFTKDAVKPYCQKDAKKLYDALTAALKPPTDGMD